MFRNPAVDTLVVLLVVLLFFGPRRLPALARSMGEGVREFKDSVLHQGEDQDKPATLHEAHAAQPPAPAAPPSATPDASSPVSER